MPILTAILVDDEQDSRNILANYLKNALIKRLQNLKNQSINQVLI